MRRDVLNFILATVSLTLAGALLGACSPAPLSPAPTPAPTANPSPDLACQVTNPIWILAPDDSAVDSEPAYGYYYVNEDASIMASAWWVVDEQYRRVNEDGVKVGWFRPEGTELVVTGQRLDGEAPPLHFHAPCCYPTRFQASGLYFPTEGCWQVTATAGDSELIFVVQVDP